ncbi:MAG TPA: hypothetical protein PLD77_00035 [Candidatus Dojkabacteria bacterium]|nr:hypothetical protein [Candidatus Dojkabacteria bacterium]
MFEQISQKIASFVPNWSPLAFFVLTVFICLYVFWKECSRTRKNNSSVFDAFFISVISGIILGRAFYIIGNWGEFSKYIWYWLPYERYGNEIFLFRLLPWRFFRIWDLGIDILFLLLGFCLVCTWWVLRVKKWKWSHLFPAIYLSSFTVLAFSFFSIGKITGNNTWVAQGLIMIVLILVFWIVKAILIKSIIGLGEMKALVCLDSIFVVISTAVIITVYMNSQMLNVEKIGLGAFVTWSLLGLFFHIADTRKATVTIEKLSSVRNVSVDDIRKPIKLPREK